MPINDTFFQLDHRERKQQMKTFQMLTYVFGILDP